MNPLSEPDANWRDPENQKLLVAHLMTVAGRDTAADLDRLAVDPLGVLMSHPAITVRYTDDAGNSCGVYGFYRAEPPTITLQGSSAWGRDNFTVLHEYAHHLQQHDDVWADTLWRIPQPLRGWIEEEICDIFASNVLLPASAVIDGIGSGVPTALSIADLYMRMPASRLAICRRVTDLLTADNPAFIALASLDGRILFARSSNFGLLPQPPRGSLQPDLARLISGLTITAPSSVGPASEGIAYTTGSTRHDIRLSVSLDYEARYAFVAASPESRYGRQQWSRREHECSSPNCGTVFTVDGSVQVCAACGDPTCPECGTCSCECQVATFCRHCFLALSIAEAAAGESLCSACR